MVSADVAADVLAWAREQLAPDPHGSGAFGDEYHTTSLYFDTEAFDVYHRRGSFGRSKYRIRRYGHGDTVFLERKLRTGSMLTKRRTQVPLQTLDQLGIQPSVAGWDGEWFRQRLEARGLRPVCQVHYNRIARIMDGPRGMARLTIDQQIQVLRVSGLEFVAGEGLGVLATHCVLELKFETEVPVFFKTLAERFALSPAPVSKYRLSLERLNAAAADTGTTETRLGTASHAAEIARA